MSDDITVGSASVTIEPDARGWKAKAQAQILPQAEQLGRELSQSIAGEIPEEIRNAMAAGLAEAGVQASTKGRQSGAEFGGEFGKQAHTRIQAALKALPKADLDIDASAADRKLAEVRARMAALSDKKIGVDLDAWAALREMGQLESELRAIASDAVEIDVKVNTGKALAELVAFRGFAAAAGGGIGGGIGDIGAAAASSGKMAGSLGSAAGSMGVLGVGAVVLASTIGPIVGAAAGIAAALAAPLGAATIGGFLFAGLGMAAVKDVEETNKKIGQTRQRLRELGEQAEKLNNRAKEASTDASRKSLLAQRDEVIKERKALAENAKALRQSLTEGEKAYLSAKDTLSGAFDELMSGPAGGAVLGTIATGLEVLADLLPEVEPLVVSVGDALSEALNDIDADDFGAWVDKLAELAGPTITDGISILGDLGGALDAVLTSGSDTGVSALSGIADAAERLNEYLRSPEGQQDLQDFFEWLQTDGLQVGQAIWDIGEAMADWLVRAEPLGMAVIDISDAIANLYSGILDLRDFGLDVLLGDWSGAFSHLADMVAHVLDFYGSMLDAMGQIPGFGWAKDAAEKMHGAARQAHDLADNIDGIKPKDVKINVETAGAAELRALKGLIDGMNDKTVKVAVQGYSGGITKAEGGPIIGPGTGTSDSIPAWLSNGEHVLTAAEVAAAGGHGAILQFRRMLRTGAVGFADGGPVGQVAASFGIDERSAERILSRVLNGAQFNLAEGGRSLRLKTLGG